MTSPDDEKWGPFIEHDGMGCPCVGQWVLAQGLTQPNGEEIEAELMAQDTAEWDWTYFGKIGFSERGNRRICGKVIRYRIWRNRALRELIHMVENLPARKGGGGGAGPRRFVPWCKD